MTKQDFKDWSSLSQTQQVNKFKFARISLGLTQIELGEELEIYGYRGGRKTIEAWEQGLRKIPFLVYELVYEEFAERSKNEASN
jgi:DNA-binding XRE family transcriptional regulator